MGDSEVRRDLSSHNVSSDEEIKVEEVYEGDG